MSHGLGNEDEEHHTCGEREKQVGESTLNHNINLSVLQCYTFNLILKCENFSVK